MKIVILLVDSDWSKWPVKAVAPLFLDGILDGFNVISMSDKKDFYPAFDRVKCPTGIRGFELEVIG